MTAFQGKLSLFDELLQLHSVVGVVRYDVKPCFGTASQHTFVFTRVAVVAFCFVRGYGLWDWLPIDPSEKPQPELLRSVVPWLSLQMLGFQHFRASPYRVEGACPPEVGDWDQICALARKAPSCHPPILDGVSYGHVVYGRGYLIHASWSNPQPEEQPIQRRLIGAYSRLLAAANLTPHLVQEAFGLNQKPEPALVEYDDNETEPESSPSSKKRRKSWQCRR